MAPDVDRLVGHLEGAEDAVHGGAAGVPVARHDSIFPEHLRDREGHWQALPREISKSKGEENGEHKSPKARLNTA